MRVIFMGTPDFSVPILEALVEEGHQVVGVVTQPDKPKGRGKAILMTPVKEKALEYQLPVYQPKKVRDPEFVRVLKEQKADIMVVAAFGQILSKEVLEIPPMGCVNVHASLLPKYRGSAPIQWAVINGEKETGVTTMMMDEGIDTGDMLEKEVVFLDADETGDSLHRKLSQAGSRLIISTLKKLEEKTLVPTPQPEEGSSYVKMLKKEMGDLDWTMEAQALERLVRGLNSWPGTYTRWKGKTLKIWKAAVVDREYEGVYGQVVHTDQSTILVKTGKGALALLELQPEGKKRMDTAAFLRGYPVEEGTVFAMRVPDGG